MPKSVPSKALSKFDPEWFVSDKPVPYLKAMAAMETRVDRIIQGDERELLWFLEHPALYSGGTSAEKKELKETARFPVFETGRGGRYTYHGPGQRVIYAMVDLRERGRDVRLHVNRLEEWMIRALSEFGIVGQRRQGRVGIWVETESGEKKIGALGVRVRKWVAYHGLALNVDPDLSHFSGIVPCGLDAFGVTSMRELGVEASLQDVDEAFKQHLFSLTA